MVAPHNALLLDERERVMNSWSELRRLDAAMKPVIELEGSDAAESSSGPAAAVRPSVGLPSTGPVPSVRPPATIRRKRPKKGVTPQPAPSVVPPPPSAGQTPVVASAAQIHENAQRLERRKDVIQATWVEDNIGDLNHDEEMNFMMTPSGERVLTRPALGRCRTSDGQWRHCFDLMRVYQAMVKHLQTFGVIEGMESDKSTKDLSNKVRMWTMLGMREVPRAAVQLLAWNTKPNEWFGPAGWVGDDGFPSEMPDGLCPIERIRPLRASSPGLFASLWQSVLGRGLNSYALKVGQGAVDWECSNCSRRRLCRK